jgi:RNA polymerase sigma-70 factor, ECF subfamily
MKWCGNKNNAEDITQEACIKLARGLHTFRHDCAFTSWLYRLVINAAKDWVKSQSRHPSGDAGLEFAQTDENTENALYARQVWAQVYALPEGEKDAVLLVMVEGMSHKQAAEILNIKESTVSGRIHEARKKLFALFGKEQSYG